MANKSLWAFKEYIKTRPAIEKIFKSSANLPKSKKVMMHFKKELFKELIASDDYQEFRKEHVDKKRAERTKETEEKLPELVDKNFRIDSTGRKEVTGLNGVKVLVNPEWDVREHLEWENKWEQLFTQASALRETKKAGKKLPPSWTIYRDIIEKKYKWNYKDFLKWEKIMFSGWRRPVDERFDNVDKWFAIRCADGSDFYGHNGHRDTWNTNKWNRDFGFSVRCLKD